ncbi:hypothetical protein N7454_005142 [Penicillium verhagenii]|nr:hypothetical protein N7454_005142 [Penicillium verhagenii]
MARLSNSWGLCIYAGKYDLYEISQSLVHLILKRPKLHSTLTLEMLLKTDLPGASGRRDRPCKREAAWAAEQAQRAKEERPEPQSQQSLMPGSAEERQIAPSDPTMPERAPRGFLNHCSPSRMMPLLHLHLIPPKDPQQPRPEQSVSADSPHRLQQELLSAVQACRPHGSSNVFSRPETNQISASQSYCDERPGHDLEFVATLPSGVNVLFVKTITERSAFLANNRTSINIFASVLLDSGSIFAMRADSLSIFYDPGGKTIAFNRAGSIFCNYFYFQKLQEQALLQSSTPDRTDAIVYWWVILCHELAHNLVADHSSAHSYYTEGFVAQYFPKVAAKLATLQPGSGAA